MSSTIVDPKIILGLRADGRPIYAIMGGSVDEPPADGDTPPEGAAEVDADAPPADPDPADEDEEDDDEPDSADLKAALEYWQGKAKKNGNEARNLRTAKKDLEAQLTPLQQAARERELSEMKDIDAANATINDLRATVEKLTKENGLAAVTSRYDLPARVLAKLEGDTPEALLVSADGWAKDLGIERKDTKPRRTKAPAQELAGGRDPEGSKTASIADQLKEAERTKDFNAMRILKARQVTEQMFQQRKQ